MENIDLGGSKDVPRRRRLTEWIATRSRKFWLIVVLSTILTLVLGIILGIYFLVNPHSTSTAQTIPPGEHIKPPEQKNINSRDLTHSFLVDLNTAEDEPTREAVMSLYFKSDDRIERMFLPI